MKKIFNISSGKDSDTTEQVLSIRLGAQHFGFAISNRVSNELLQLNWYTADHAGDFQLQEVFNQHPEFRHSFYKIMIGYDHSGSVLLPPGLPSQNDPRILLETMYGVNGTHAVIAENIEGWQLQNVYAVPAETKEWVSRHFPSGQCLHNYSICIKQISNTGSEGSLLLDFHTNDFIVVAAKSNKLLLAQCFSYSTPADVIYYLLKIAKEFSLSQESVSLALSGLVEKESNLYRELAQYFLHIGFREPAWQMPVTDEAAYPSHFFTSLNDLAVCAS